MKNNENGRSMIEMLGVLAIIGVLSVGGIAGYSKAMSKYRTNKVIEQATYLITNIRTMFAQQQTYAGLGNERAINLQLVPEEMIMYGTNKEPTGKLRNVFSGEVVIGSSPIDALDTDAQGAFKVSFYGLSRDACIQIATSDWGAGSSSGLVAMHIWDTKPTTTGGSTGGSTQPGDSGTGEDAPVSGIELSSLQQGVKVGIASVGKKDASTTPSDKDIDKIYKVGATGSKNMAVPGHATYKVPFTVIQAQEACACTSKTTCAITWKYF